MKYLKMLGLAAVAAMALTAFLGAGTASATVLCKTTPTASGTEATCPSSWHHAAGTTITASVASGQSATLTDTFATVVCTSSHVKGKTANTGGKTETVTGPIEELTFGGCTCNGNPAHVTADTNAAGNYGTLEVHRKAGTHDGTITAKEATVTVNCTSLGSMCAYETGSNPIDLGTLTGGHTATFDINATVLWDTTAPGQPGTFACSGFNHEAVWEGNYTVTSPSTLWVADFAD